MFASVVEIQLKPGALDEAVAIARAAIPELRDMTGIKQLITIDKGNDKGLVVVIYESRAAQEAATPKAREILGRVIGLAVAHCEIVLRSQHQRAVRGRRSAPCCRRVGLSTLRLSASR